MIYDENMIYLYLLTRADGFLYKSILQKYTVDTVEEVSETV